MSLFGTGDAAKYWKRALTGAIGGTPVTVSCWVRNMGSDATQAWFQNTAQNGGELGFATSGGTLYPSYARDGSNKFYYQSTISGTAWHHLLFVVSSNTVGSYYQDGVATGSQTSAGVLADADWNLFMVNGPQGATAAPTTQQVAEVAVWRGTLGAPAATALANGISPLRVKPGILQDYWPLRGTLRNFGPGGVGLTPVGGAAATYGDHPNVEPPPSKRRVLFAAVVNGSANPGVGSLTFTGYQPSVSAGVTPGAGSLTFTGFQPAVAVNTGVGAGTLTFTGFAPTVSASSTASPGPGLITFSGKQPSVTGGNANIAVGVGALTFTGFQPSVTASSNATPNSGQLTFTGFPPLVSSTSRYAFPGAGTLTFTGYPPTITTDGWTPGWQVPDGGPLQLNGLNLTLNRQRFLLNPQNWGGGWGTPSNF